MLIPFIEDARKKMRAPIRKKQKLPRLLRPKSLKIEHARLSRERAQRKAELDYEIIQAQSRGYLRWAEREEPEWVWGPQEQQVRKTLEQLEECKSRIVRYYCFIKVPATDKLASYGMTLDEREETLFSQRGRCGICNCVMKKARHRSQSQNWQS